MGWNPSRREIKASLVALLAGACVPLSLAPWTWWGIGIFSAAVLAFLTAGGTSRTIFLRCCWFGVGQFGTGISWIYVSISGYGEVPAALAVLMTAAFVLLIAIIFAAPFSVLGCLKRRHTLALLFAFPAAWAVSEWLRSWLLTGFPWLYLGYGHINSPLAGWAPVLGVQGISWIVAFAGATVASAASWFHSRLPLLLGTTLTAALTVAGFGLKQVEWTTPIGEPLKIGMIQPALTLEQKWDSKEIINILKLYFEQTQELLDNDIIVWPESAIPILKHHIDSFLDGVGELAADNNAALILGVPIMDPQTRNYYNSIISIGAGAGNYHKQRLVPFGEYVPLENWIRGTIKFFDLPMSNFSKGPTSQPNLSAKNYHIGAYVCYEIAYPELVAATAATANLLLTVSNDTWFGASIGPDQHLEIAQMRALENAKPLIRATNDGFSALIDHRGQVVTTAPRFARTTLEGILTPRIGETPINRFGELPLYLLALLSLLPCAWQAYCTRTLYRQA